MFEYYSMTSEKVNYRCPQYHSVLSEPEKKRMPFGMRPNQVLHLLSIILAFVAAAFGAFWTSTQSGWENRLRPAYN